MTKGGNHYLYISSLLFALTLIASAPIEAGETTLVSIAADGTQGNSSSFQHAMTPDGRYVAFSSGASNFSPNDSNGTTDIYLKDMTTGDLELISVSSAGENSDAPSLMPSISDNGRYVAFQSIASNLGGNVSNGRSNIYLRDRVLNLTTLITGAATTANSGRSNDDSVNPQLSTDGRFVAFESRSSNLVLGDTNDSSDVFVHDRLNLITTIASIGPNGEAADNGSTMPDISGDGRFVVFASAASNLTSNDTNGMIDIFRFDRQNNTTALVSVRTSMIPGFPVAFTVRGDGNSSKPSISDNGRFVVFQSSATNFNEADDNDRVDIFLRDMSPRFPIPTTTINLQHISMNSSGEIGDDNSDLAEISSDGGYISYRSEANNLVPDDTGIAFIDHFVFDRILSLTERISVNTLGRDSNPNSFGSGPLNPRIQSTSSDGRYILFQSTASDLVAGDTNNGTDVFRRDRGALCDVTALANKQMLAVNTWRLLSVPCAPPVYSTVLDLFDDDITGTYGTSWTIFRYDPTLTTPGYVTPFATESLAPGQGFWIIQADNTNGVTLDLPAGSREVPTAPTATNSACTSADGCLGVRLSGAPNTDFLWNIIGNPLPASVPVTFDDLRVSTLGGACAAASGCTMSEAAAADIVADRFFHYNGVAYEVRETGSALGAWEGYWAPELPASEFNEPTILVPR